MQRQIRAARRPTVLVYRSVLLPLSETFVKEQLIVLRRWRGVLVGLRRLEELPLDGIDVWTFKADCLTFFERLHWKLNKWMRKLPRPVFARLRQEGASLLHVHFGVDAIEAWPIAKSLNLPMLVTLHGYDINIYRDWWEAGHGGRSMRSYPARLLELARQPRVRFLAVSDAIRQRSISYGIPANKISVQYIGIDCTKFIPHGHPIGRAQAPCSFCRPASRERRDANISSGRLLRFNKQLPMCLSSLSATESCEAIWRNFRARTRCECPISGLIIKPRGKARTRLGQGLLSTEHLGASNGDAEGLPIVLLEAQAFWCSCRDVGGRWFDGVNMRRCLGICRARA